MNKPGGLTQRQSRAIGAILASETQEQAAITAGVSVRTLRNWLAAPAFQRELARARTRALSDASTILSRGAAACARALVAMGEGTKPASAAAVAAAAKVIELAIRSAETDDMGTRLTALEQALSDAPRTSRSIQ